MTSALQAGRLLFVDEVLAQSHALRGSSVRVTGTLVSYDAVTQEAAVEHRGSTLVVDTRHACPSAYRPRSLMQFIGEVDVRQDRVVLAARVARCVDGLDMHLYQQAVALRRDFERQNDASMMT